MKTELLDAVKTATSIHKGDFSFLSGKSFLACDSIKNKKRRNKPMGKPKSEKMTLSKLAIIVNDLAKEMRAGFKQVNVRLDNLENDVNSLKQEVNNINARLDRVEARLDYNGLQIERIEKRLDYNNLKRLPSNK